MQIVPETKLWEWEDIVERYITPPDSSSSYPSVQVRQGCVGVKMAGAILVGSMGADQPKPGQKVRITVEVIDGP